MPTRRDFVATTGSALLGLAAAPAILPRRRALDLVIRGGTVFDGTGSPGVERDLAILDGRIVEIAERIRQTGTEEFDARGLAVAPGFIDIHSHGDSNLDEDPRAESLIRQGITTIIVGQDGDSAATGETAGLAPDSTPGSFTDLFRGIERLQPAVNVASMVGLGTVRGAVIGERDRPATGEELARMTRMVESALAQGACGASSGLEYTPGAFASREELIALCRPLAPAGLPYATHMRNEDDRVLEAIDEAIAVAHGAGCPLQISHLKMQGPRNWDKLDQAFVRIAQARAAGMDVAFDRYPYVAYQTGLTNLFPVWSRDGGIDAFLGRLNDPAAAGRIRQEALAKVDLLGGWDNVMVTSVRAEEDKPAQGQHLGSYARSLGVDPYELAVGLLRRSHGGVGMVGFAMSEGNLERILNHPLSMVCSDGGSYAIDGPTRRGSPHPRGLGTFPRVLGHYVRVGKILKLEEAIRKMTAFPAARVRLSDRGRLAPGQAADVAVFDPARVEDRATFEDPFQYPVGVSLVVVNGAVALRERERRLPGAGKALRPQPRSS
ncbi:MAG: amidohydrolase family protein [Gemmatimonadales bacterium]